jgi:hypothetical protein
MALRQLIHCKNMAGADAFVRLSLLSWKIAVHEADLSEADLRTSLANANWCRPVLQFAGDPSMLITKLRRALEPGPQANNVFHALT